MPKINILPKQVSELIAAGEVVERPSSVVKELLENSIDAGATSITLEIKNGGITYIRITDNGCGISREDVPSAFISHATSKISSADDLDAIFTLGFRGEALASIAAVSRVEMMTRAENEQVGTRYVVEGGEEILIDDAGCPCGTTLIIRDLFYNTPARMKFLKKDVAEANSVAGVADRLALSHPEVSMRFIRDGKETLFTSGDGKLESTIYSVFGRDFLSGMLPVEYGCDGVKVSGFTSKPSAARPNRSMQFFFLNGRLIRTGTGSAALSEAYKNSILVGKYPSCVLNLFIPPYIVDVNVHPAKIEVRFSNEKTIFNALYYAIKTALDGDKSHVQHTLKHENPAAIKAYNEVLRQASVQSEQIKFSGGAPSAISGSSSIQRATSTPAPHAAQTAASHMPVGSFGAQSPPIHRKETSDELSDLVLSSPSVPHIPDNSNDLVTEPSEESSVIDADSQDIAEKTETNSDESIPNENTAAEAPDFRIIGEAFKTYIFAELRDTVLIIDKHAAHERMIFEELRSRGDGCEKQLLLSPVTVTLNKDEYNAVLENLSVLSESGFGVEDFGFGMVIVNECPIILDISDIPDVIMEFAGFFAENKNVSLPSKLDWIYHSASCRAAVKAGDFTSEYEQRKFVEKLLSMPDIRCCPHGRPVMIEMTRREMEKSFGRI